MAKLQLALTLGCLLTFAVWHMVEGGGTLELKMNVYENPEAKDMGGGNCDPLWGACDHYFTFSIDASDGKQATPNDAKTGKFFTKTTGYFQDMNKDTFSQDISGMKNPIVQYFDSWPGQVLFKVFIKDDDTIFDPDDEIDAIIYRLSATPEGTAGTAPWHNNVVRGMRKNSPTSLDFDYRLYCELNFYGPSCSKECHASDSDTEGHFTCNPRTGDLVCLPGWDNPDTKCLTRANQCLGGNKCRNGATCVSAGTTYTCTCAAGYAGNVCEATVSGSCPAGYVGQSCDVKLCDYISCQNGGSCVDGVCKCPAGYSGAKCESSNVCSTRPCKNDGTCYSVQYRCDCLPGFEGETCSITSGNVTAKDLLRAEKQSEMSLVNAFNASQPRALLIALIVIASVFLILVIVLLILLIRFRRRALKAENECIMLSHGASSSFKTEKSTVNNNNTYHSTRFNTLCSSSSSCDTDATSCRSPSSSVSAEPDYADLNDSNLARAEYAYANNAVMIKPDAPPKRSCKGDDLKDDYLP